MDHPERRIETAATRVTFHRRREPCARKRPIALDSASRQVEFPRGFFHRQPGEETQLHNLSGSWKRLPEVLQRPIQSRQHRLDVVSRLDARGQRRDIAVFMNDASAPLAGQTPASVIDQPMPDFGSHQSEERVPILDRPRSLAQKAQICFVEHRGGLQRVPAALTPQMRVCHAPQFWVGTSNELFAGLGVPRPPFLQQPSDITGHRRVTSTPGQPIKWRASERRE